MGPQRGSRVGTWQSLSGPDGQLRGGLRLDQGTLDQAIADRLSEAVRATRTLNLPGLNTLIDQVHDGEYPWLISNVPANPTITSLLAAQPNLLAAAAQLIAVDIGQTLSALHAAYLGVIQALLNSLFSSDHLLTEGIFRGRRRKPPVARAQLRRNRSRTPQPVLNLRTAASSPFASTRSVFVNSDLSQMVALNEIEHRLIPAVRANRR